MRRVGLMHNSTWLFKGKQMSIVTLSHSWSNTQVLSGAYYTMPDKETGFTIRVLFLLLCSQWVRLIQSKFNTSNMKKWSSCKPLQVKKLLLLTTSTWQTTQAQTCKHVFFTKIKEAEIVPNYYLHAHLSWTTTIFWIKPKLDVCKALDWPTGCRWSILIIEYGLREVHS